MKVACSCSFEIFVLCTKACDLEKHFVLCCTGSVIVSATYEMVFARKLTNMRRCLGLEQLKVFDVTVLLIEGDFYMSVVLGYRLQEGNP